MFKKITKSALKKWRQWHEEKPVFLTEQQCAAFKRWYVEHHCGICGKELMGFEYGDAWADNGRCLCEPCAEFVRNQRKKLPGSATIVGHC